MKRTKKGRYNHERFIANAQKGTKNASKNVLKNAVKNVNLNKGATLPAKSAVSANKGSDLLRFARNKSVVAEGRRFDQPLPLREDQVVYLRSTGNRL